MKPRELRKHHNHALKGVRTYGGTLSYGVGPWSVFMWKMRVTARRDCEVMVGGVMKHYTDTVYDVTHDRVKDATADFYNIAYAALLNAVPNRIEPQPPRKHR